MNILIVEDEQLGCERLIKLLKETNYDFNICGQTASIKSTLRWLANNPPPDLIFLDIELADGQCFEIFNQTEVPSPIIFTTSYDEYALYAFRVNSIDYLLKPIRKEELERSLKKFVGLKNQHSSLGIQANIEMLLKELREMQQPKYYRHRFLVKHGQRLLSIEVNDIAWFHAEGKLCFIKTWEKQRYIIDYTLEDLTGMLDPNAFCRVNRSYIVNIRAIKNANTFFKGKLILQLNPPAEENDVIISKEKATEIKQWLGK